MKQLQKVKMPLYLQPTENTCVLACLKMILEFYGINKSIDDIASSLPVGLLGVGFPDLGLFLIHSGFDVEICVNDHRAAFIGGCLGSEAIENLLKYTGWERIKPDLQKFTELGGRFSLGMMTLHGLIRKLSEGRQLIAAFNRKLYFGRSDWNVGYHAVVLTHSTNKKIVVHDPMIRHRKFCDKFFIEKNLSDSIIYELAPKICKL